MGITMGICDDEVCMIEELRYIINAYASEKNVEIEIHTYVAGQELLREDLGLDVLFLDIAMPEMDGIEVGRQLCLRQKNCRIIMATSMVERFKEAFEVQAFRFVTKPFERQEVWNALDAYMHLRIGMKEIEFYEARNSYLVMQQDISYLRACNSSVEGFVNGRLLRKESSLNEMDKVLDQRLFCRVHRQYIVNFRYIEKYKDGIIYLGHLEIPVARRKKKEFEWAYRQFDVTYR